MPAERRPVLKISHTIAFLVVPKGLRLASCHVGPEVGPGARFRSSDTFGLLMLEISEPLARSLV